MKNTEKTNSLKKVWQAKFSSNIRCETETEENAKQ